MKDFTGLYELAVREKISNAQQGFIWIDVRKEVRDDRKNLKVCGVSFLLALAPES